MISTLLLAALMLFPNIQARDLDGQDHQSDQLRGQPAALLIGFTFESRKDLGAWGSIIAKVTKGNLRTLEMPVYSGLAVFARAMIDGSMARKIPKADHANVWTSTDSEKITKALGITSPEKGGVTILVDAEGQVRWRQQGAPSDFEIETFTKAYQELQP